MEAIQNLSTNPESVVNRQLFIAQCESFIETAKNAYTAITKYQSGLNTEVAKQVKEVNDIADKIAALNKTIAEKEASGVENPMITVISEIFSWMNLQNIHTIPTTKI